MKIPVHVLSGFLGVGKTTAVKDLLARRAAFERIAAAAPEDLRKGPRGGGRDRTKVVEHVHGGDDSYASVIGIPAADRRSSPALRERILTILREPSDGSPIAGKRWPPRYAARRIAWHALDHAWEIEDRTEAA